MKKQFSPSTVDHFNTSIIYMLCLLLMIAPFVRGLFFDVYLLPFIIVVSILFVVLMYCDTISNKSAFFDHPLDWAVLALLAAYILSLLGAVSIRSAVLGVFKTAAALMVFWMCYRTARRSNGFSSLMRTFYISGTGTAVLAMLIFCGIIAYPYIPSEPRVAGTLEYANTLGVYAGLVSMLGWGFILSSQNQKSRSILAGGNAVLIMAMLTSISRGTWLLYPFAVLAFLFLLDAKKRGNAILTWLAFTLPGLLAGRFFYAYYQSKAAAFFILAGFILGAGFQYGADYMVRYLQQRRVSKKLGLSLIAASLLVLAVLAFFVLPSAKSLLAESYLSRLGDVSLQDQNVQLRIDFSRDALKIIKDHPVIGVGAGGWAALYHTYASRLYWTLLTHNHFLQTWVEAGTIGFLALLSIWFLFLYLVYNYWSKPKEDIDQTSDPLLWGGVTGVLLLGAHSIIDFDMSLPAIYFLFFAFMGTFKGFVSVPPLHSETEKKAAKKKGRPKGPVLDKKSVIFLALATAGSLAICITAASFWIANLNFRSAQSIITQNTSLGVQKLDNALALDPINSEYWIWSAKVLADKAVKTNDPNAYQKALECCQKAIDLDPYNLSQLYSINQVYIKLGQPDPAIKVASDMIRINPWAPDYYENLAAVQVAAGIFRLEAGNIEQAKAYWADSVQVPNLVPPTMAIPPVGLHLFQGQARLLLGDTAQGVSSLQTMLEQSGLDDKGTITQVRLEQVNTYKLRARVWLAAYFEIAGDHTRAQSLIDQNNYSDRSELQSEYQKAKVALSKTFAARP